MDEKYYLKKTLDRFIKDTLCEGDKVTYNHFQKGNTKLFRKRLKNKDLVEQVVYVACTNILRDIIYEIIEKLTLHMKDWGDVVITGGEAFNNYFDIEDRVVSSDIDTKFVPRFMSSFNKKFFGYLQYCKLYLWQYLGLICSRYNKRVQERLRSLRKTHIGKMLGIRECSNPVCLKRRYTLIKKSPQKDVLIDVELFALDLSVKYYSPEKKKIVEHSLGGILDVPMMRPYEIGYEVAFTRKRGLYVTHPITGDLVYHKNVMLASERFLIEDLYIMKSLGLRPSKVKKDRKRMINFAKKVLRVKNINSKTTDKEIFSRTLKLIKPTRTFKLVKPGRNLPNTNHKLSAERYTKYTTEPKLKTIKKFVGPGIKTKNFVSINGFEKTSGNMYFDRKTHTWKKSRNPHYVRNRYNFRPTTSVVSKPVNLKNSLYSYVPSRNNWVPPKIIEKAAMIPLVGLKKSNVKTLVK